MRTLVFLVVLILALSLADAGRRNRGRGGRNDRRSGRRRVRGLPRDAQNVVSWNRDLGEQTAKEYSFTLPSSTDHVFVISADKRHLKRAGFRKSKTIYDFTNGNPVVVLKVKKWCFKLDMPEDLTRNTVLQDVAALNETTRGATSIARMYPTELDPESVTEIRSRPVLYAMCSKVLKALTPVAPEGASAGKEVKVTTPDHLLSITKVSRRRQRQ